mmetsp:Transcript_14439/g.28886  ORF Transcript_14439/g.28886 Transcript_14439/m.28886 type:complete len:218 (+) Transcript_14439:618-1271(+)
MDRRGLVDDPDVLHQVLVLEHVYGALAVQQRPPFADQPPPVLCDDGDFFLLLVVGEGPSVARLLGPDRHIRVRVLRAAARATLVTAAVLLLFLFLSGLLVRFLFLLLELELLFLLDPFWALVFEVRTLAEPAWSEGPTASLRRQVRLRISFGVRPAVHRPVVYERDALGVVRRRHLPPRLRPELVEVRVGALHVLRVLIVTLKKVVSEVVQRGAVGN